MISVTIRFKVLAAVAEISLSGGFYVGMHDKSEANYRTYITCIKIYNLGKYIFEKAVFIMIFICV